MKQRINFLSGDGLNWAVAKCEAVDVAKGLTNNERYTTEWSQGGLIIDREKIDLSWSPGKLECFAHISCDPRKPFQPVGLYSVYCHASTPLVAAMRCYVISRMGLEIDIPEEFLL